MTSTNNTDNARFEFGQNWADFSNDINDETLELAIEGLKKLLPKDFDPNGKSFLDIGSGSGLHAIAAAKIGFSKILCTDYDINSTNTTKRNAEKFDVAGVIEAFQDDILNSKLNEKSKEKFDIVYSWGVLHHTGNMWKAITNASKFVKDDGHFIIAIYTKTKFCNMWKIIKRTYCNAPKFVQKVMGYKYHFIRSFRQILNGELFKKYEDNRGMNRYYDSIDWLGGYPYESASSDEIISFLEKDFLIQDSFSTTPGLGLLGTGCAEYTFRKK